MANSTNTATMKRIQREIRDVQKEDMGEITLQPSERNIFQWIASIPGPEGSVYEGGVFNLRIDLPRDYPFSSPHVVFTTRIYHMNVSQNGNICIDVLKSAWSPALSLFKVMLSISSLLTDPNPKDPLVPQIAQEYTRNRAQHDATARDWTKLYAEPPALPKPKAAIPKPKTKQPTTTNSIRATASTNSSRAGSAPTVTTNSKAKGKSRAQASQREVIELSSDHEGSHDQPIEIDSDNDEAEVPPAGKGKGRVASRTKSNLVPKPTASAPVAGTKRMRSNADDEDVIDLDDEGDAAMGATSSSMEEQSLRRPTKRQEVSVGN